MNVALSVKITYDKARDGGLAQFRKKYMAFREHLNRMQASGMLPRGEMKVVIELKRPDGPGPFDPKPAVGRLLPFNPMPSLVPVHCSGQRLDVGRIAM